MNSKGKLLIIDGNGIAYRAFYALPSFKTITGIQTNAVYGFTTMLLKVLQEEAPTHVAASFDKSAPTVRLEAFKDYKIHRQKMPEDLMTQFPLIEEVLKVFNIPVYWQEGHEADDCIATIAKKAEGEGMDVLILSGDLDMLQLVSHHIKVMVTRKGISETVLYDVQAVKERYGVTPSKIPDIKSLAGDSSDGIPGIFGIGDTTASKLIARYGSLEELLENIKDLPEKTARLISDRVQDAVMSKNLATLVAELPLEINWDDCKVKKPDSNLLKELFTSLEFKTLLKRFGEDVPPEITEAPKFKIVERAGDIDSLIKEITGEDLLGIVFIFSNESAMDSEIMGVAISAGNKNFYISAGSPGKELMLFDTESPEALSPKSILQKIKPLLENSSLKKIGCDFKLLFAKMIIEGMEGNNFIDLSIASFLLEPDETHHQCRDIAAKFLQMTLPGREALFGKGAKSVSPADIDKKELASWACSQSRAALKLYPLMKKELSEKELADLYENAEMPLVNVLAAMEAEGVSINVPCLKEISAEMDSMLSRFSEEIYDIAGGKFNINSPKQMGEVLFEKIKIPADKKTKTGYATGADILAPLAEKYPIVVKIIKYRELSKLKSTYVDALPKMINPVTGRIHTTFSQMTASTGRLASSNPNLQNIPVRTEWGRWIRKAFIPSREDELFLCADYSQIELRILAHLSDDHRLVEAFFQDMDIHTKTAMEIFGVEKDAVNAEMRRKVV
ncbi:MAG: DNA polymerase I [Firmicutes bacterium]|nr:DNA polymerase I [Bacillota bacterium]